MHAYVMCILIYYNKECYILFVYFKYDSLVQYRHTGIHLRWFELTGFDWKVLGLQ